MQGEQLIDSSHARVPCDLCCVQASALAMPACKWASRVCMRCVWCRSACMVTSETGLGSVKSSVDGADAGLSADEVVRASLPCLRNVQTMSSRQRPGGAAPRP